MMTVNISLPKSLYQDIKKTIKERGYSSVSELMRDAVRKIVYPELTENGFTPEFEEAVLDSAKEPVGKGIILKTNQDVRKYFHQLHKRLEKRRHGKS